MAKAFEPSILTANDLISGDVVYFCTGDRWTRDLAAAVVAETPEATAELEAQGKAAETANRVVGAYLVAIRPGENGPVPVRRREQIRTLGPTIRTDLGPQAESRPARSHAA